MTPGANGLLAALAWIAWVASSPAQELVADLSGPLRPIPDDFLGLSFESSQLLARTDGKHEFSPANRPLQTLMRTLGIRNLRFGGNLADSPNSPDPKPADADPAFELARGIDATVIYTLRFSLGGGHRPFEAADPAKALVISRHITDKFPDRLAAFTIGNEPDMYFANLITSRAASTHAKLTKSEISRQAYLAYRTEWRKYAGAILAGNPAARFNGPSSTGKPDWTKWFGEDFARDPGVALITNHYYPGGNGKQGQPADKMGPMLSAAWQRRYADYLAGNGFAALGKRPFRIEECNSYYSGGAPGVSNSFGAALWALDFAHWFAARGCSGVNFHASTASRHGRGFLFYTPFSSNTANSATPPAAPGAGGYFTHPVGYAALLFKLGSHGRSVPLDVKTGNGNLAAYAVGGQNGHLYVTLINKEYDAPARTVSIRIRMKGGKLTGTGESLALLAPGNDVRATEGMTAGGAPVAEDGTWAGKWQPLPASAFAADGMVSVTVPPASALVLKLPVADSKSIGPRL